LSSKGRGERFKQMVWLVKLSRQEWEMNRDLKGFMSQDLFSLASILDLLPSPQASLVQSVVRWMHAFRCGMACITNYFSRVEIERRGSKS